MRALRLLAVATLALGCGLWLGGHPDRLPTSIRDAFVDDRLSTVAEAVEIIEEDYFKPVSRTRLQDRSISGMVDFLRRKHSDRFSHYFDPKTFKRFQESTSGRFSGVGLTVNEVKQGLRVVEVFEGSPAKRAKIQPGELIIAVNGRSIAGDSSNASTARIKGPPGSTVRLTVLDPDSDRRRILAIKRAEIKVSVTRANLRRADRRRVGHVRLAQFSRGAHAALRTDIERLYRRGAEGLVFDLRGNGGGLLTEAILVSSLFIERGTVVTTRRRSGAGERVFKAEGDALKRKPLVVLIDRDSASASEIVTAALRERDLAVVVGDCPAAAKAAECRTFGKGVFQQVTELGNGGALDLTVGQFFTPEGRSLAGRGVRADVRTADRRETERDEALDGALRELGHRLR